MLHGSGAAIIIGAAARPIAGRFGCRDDGTTTITFTGTIGIIITTTGITTIGITTIGITTTATVGIAIDRRSSLTATV
jgi:hypothetical protein